MNVKPSPPKHDGIARWILEHDDRWSFILPYVVLAIGLSILLGLFWLGFVATLHFALEVARQRLAGRERVDVLVHALWEVKLDVGLFFFALVFVLYADLFFGLLGLSGLARASTVTKAGFQAGSRVPAWQHTLRALLLSADDALHVTKALGRNGEAGAQQQTAGGASNPWVGRWSWGDRASLAFGSLCLALIAAAPWWSGLDADLLWVVLLEELHPIPGWARGA